MKVLKFYILITILLFSCKPEKPVTIQPKEHKCEYCKMQIHDMLFDSQVITKKGRRYYFDAIECLVAWWQENKEQTDTLWVKNYANKNVWIELRQAKILQSPKIPSPMGAYFSAYKTEDEINEFQKKYGGNVLSLKEAKEYIRTQWKSDMMMDK